MMPHLAEECWLSLGHEVPLSGTEWPVAEKLNGYLSECAALGRWGIEVGCAQQHDVFKWI